jgi:hypothetical protein
MRKMLGHRLRGQSMVEFAVLAPIFFMLLLGTIDLGRAVYIYNTISDAAREGARAAIPFDTPLPTNAAVVDAVQSKLGGGFALSTDPCLATPPCASPTTPTQPNTGFIWYSSGIGTPGRGQVTVKISFRFQPWVPVIRDASGNGVVISAQSTMVTEY